MSWAGLTPTARQSGPVKGRGKKGRGNTYAKRIAVLAAYAAANTDTFLGERFRRLASRPGGGGRKKAGCAVGRSILVIVWHLLNDPAARYRDLVATHHYLGYTPLAGARLCYLIDSTAGVLAALAFAASAWRCAARDGHFGWDDVTRASRLHLVVGNARILILPHVRMPHLASAVLGAVTRRLPTDWQAAYGYPPVLAETFVQTDRFAGTSYRAANWTHVGRTTGRGKLDRHHEHLLPAKDVYLYALHRAWRTILTRPP